MFGGFTFGHPYFGEGWWLQSTTPPAPVNARTIRLRATDSTRVSLAARDGSRIGIIARDNTRSTEPGSL